MYSPSASKPISQFVAYCKSQSERGFRNHIHHARWWTKWQGEIALLHPKLQLEIRLAWENATWDGYAREHAP